MTYIKDYRRHIEGIKTYSYDNKYQYLCYTHKDSILSKKHGEKTIEKALTIPQEDIASPDYFKMLVTQEKVVGAKLSFENNIIERLADSLSLTQVDVLRLLVYRDFEFNENNKCWVYTAKTPFQRQNKYVVTAAEPYIEPDSSFKALKYYAKQQGARLIVLPLRGHQKGYGELENYHSSLQPYMLMKNTLLNETVQILGGAFPSITYANPLSKPSQIAQGKTTIVGSTRLTTESLPVMPDQNPLFLWATGCITPANYGDRINAPYHKQHHTLSALYLEFDSANTPYIRNLPIYKNSVFDLRQEYTSQEITKKIPEYLIRLGDIHVGYTDPLKMAATRNFIYQLGKPRYLLLDDVFDGCTVNHHEISQTFPKFHRPFSNLEQEFAACIEFLKKIKDLADEVVVVHSNHNSFVDKWLNTVDWRTLDSSTSYYYLKGAQLRQQNKSNRLFETIVKEAMDGISFLEDCSFSPYGNLHIHGHLGLNGAKGSKHSFRKTGYGINHCHTHTPYIYYNVFCAGTSSLRQMPYMSGLTNHAHADLIEYPAGLRQLIIYQKGKHL